MLRVVNDFYLIHSHPLTNFEIQKNLNVNEFIQEII